METGEGDHDVLGDGDGHDGLHELVLGDVLGVAAEELDDALKVCGEELALVAADDAEGGAVEEGLALDEEAVPDAGGGVDLEDVGEHGHEPVEEVVVGADLLGLEVLVELAHVVGEDEVVDAEVAEDEVDVHAVERHEEDVVHHVDEGAERVVRVHVHDEHARDVRHALDVADVGAVLRPRGEDVHGLLVEGPRAVEEERARERARQVDVDQPRRAVLDVHVALLPRVAVVDLKELLRHAHVVADHRLPHRAAHARRYALHEQRARLLLPLEPVPLRHDRVEPHRLRRRGPLLVAVAERLAPRRRDRLKQPREEVAARRALRRRVHVLVQRGHRERPRPPLHRRVLRERLRNVLLVVRRHHNLDRRRRCHRVRACVGSFRVGSFLTLQTPTSLCSNQWWWRRLQVRMMMTRLFCRRRH